MSEKVFGEIMVKDLRDMKISGGPEYVNSVYEIGVIEPILMAEWQGETFLMAGNRRIASLLAACDRAEADGTLDQRPWLESCSAVVYQNISPFDQAVWSLIENEERSDNLLLAWRTLKSLEKDQRWEDIRALLKINQARINHFKLLDRAAPELIEAYEQGKISASNLLDAARLGKRQKAVVEAYQSREGKQKRVKTADITEAKYVRNQDALASLGTLSFDVPTMPKPPTYYAVLDETGFLRFMSVNIQECQQAATSNGAWKLYQLVEVR